MNDICCCGKSLSNCVCNNIKKKFFDEYVKLCNKYGFFILIKCAEDYYIAKLDSIENHNAKEGIEMALNVF